MYGAMGWLRGEAASAVLQEGFGAPPSPAAKVRAAGLVASRGGGRAMSCWLLQGQCPGQPRVQRVPRKAERCKEAEAASSPSPCPS